MIDGWAARIGISASRMRAYLAVAEWADAMLASERGQIEHLDFVRAQLLRQLSTINPELAHDIITSSAECPGSSEMRAMIAHARAGTGSGGRTTLLSRLRAGNETGYALVPGPMTAGRRPPFSLRRAGAWVEASALWRRRKVACLQPADEGHAAAVAMEVRAGSFSSLQNRAAFMRLAAHALTRAAYEVLIVADDADAGRLLEDYDLGRAFALEAAEIWVYHVSGGDAWTPWSISS